MEAGNLVGRLKVLTWKPEGQKEDLPFLDMTRGVWGLTSQYQIVLCVAQLDEMETRNL